jgi:hypothetical protein
MMPAVLRSVVNCERPAGTASGRDSEETSTVLGARTCFCDQAPHRDHHGHIIGIIGIARDITERKQPKTIQRQDALSQSEKLATMGSCWPGRHEQ